MKQNAQLCEINIYEFSSNYILLQIFLNIYEMNVGLIL